MVLTANVQNYESRVNLYHNIFQYCLVLAVLFLIIAIVLFIILKIPRVFGEMTGQDARRAIEAMTADNKTGALGATGKIGDDGRRQRKNEKESYRTSSLSRGNQGTDVLDTRADETSLLSHGYDTYMEPKSETMVLKQNMRGGTSKQDFFILRSVMEIHTEEVI